MVYFVILHYLNINDTIECVKSIFSKCENYNIIIVDNCSNDNSGNIIRMKYQGCKNISIILLDQNIGFAKGMNVGFVQAKNQGAKFICYVNSDIELKSFSFDKKIIEVYNKSKFDVCGPIIKTLHGDLQNPTEFVYWNYHQLNKMIRRISVFRYFTFLNLDLVLPTVKKRLFGKSKEQLCRENQTLNVSTSQYGVKLHGSFLIFGPEYIKRFDGICNETFLYGEEMLLYFRLKTNKLKSYFSTDLEVLHKEDGSLNKLVKSPRNRRKFMYKHQLKSLKIIKKIVFKDGNSRIDLQKL